MGRNRRLLGLPLLQTHYDVKVKLDHNEVPGPVLFCKSIEGVFCESLFEHTKTPHTPCTAWCSEIGSLWSLNAPDLHTSVMSENQFHQTVDLLSSLFAHSHKFVYLFILGRKLNRQNCLLKEVLREREEKERERKEEK